MDKIFESGEVLYAEDLNTINNEVNTLSDNVDLLLLPKMVNYEYDFLKKQLPFRIVTNIYIQNQNTTGNFNRDQYTPSYSILFYNVVKGHTYEFTINKYIASGTFLVGYTNLSLFPDNDSDPIGTIKAYAIVKCPSSSYVGTTITYVPENDMEIFILTNKTYTALPVGVTEKWSETADEVLNGRLSQIESILSGVKTITEKYKDASATTITNLYMRNDSNKIEIGLTIKFVRNQYTSTWKVDAYPVIGGYKYKIRINYLGEASFSIFGFITSLSELPASGAYVAGTSENLSEKYTKVYNRFENLPAVNDIIEIIAPSDGYFVVLAGSSAGTGSITILSYSYDMETEGLDTVRLTNVENTLNEHQQILDNIDTYIESLDLGSASMKTNICMPDTLYAVVGEEMVIYYDAVCKGLDHGLNSPFGLYIDITCPTLQNASNRVGIRKERLWLIEASKLTSEYIGEHAMYVKVYDYNSNLLDQKQCTIKVVPKTGLSSAKNILFIGDSLTNNGPIVKTCYDDFVAIGNGTVPAFVGTRITSGLHHEGYPGYTFGTFVSASNSNASYALHIFQVPISAKIEPGDIYKLSNGNSYKVTDVRTETDTTSSVRSTFNSGDKTLTTPSTGTLTKVSGKTTSDATINYSSFDMQTGNPFWNESTAKIDIAGYRTKNMISVIDAVVIILGTNDSIAAPKDMSGSVASAKKLIDALIADNANIKIILLLTPADANTTSSWQVYADGTGSRKIGYWSNYWSLRKLLIETFNTDTYAANVAIGLATLGVDRYYGYGYEQKLSSKRVSVMEDYHTNSVHPGTIGYLQIGDGCYLLLLGMLL